MGLRRLGTRVPGAGAGESGDRRPGGWPGSVSRVPRQAPNRHGQALAPRGHGLLAHSIISADHPVTTGELPDATWNSVRDLLGKPGKRSQTLPSISKIQGRGWKYRVHPPPTPTCAMRHAPNSRGTEAGRNQRRWIFASYSYFSLVSGKGQARLVPSVGFILIVTLWRGSGGSHGR